MPEMGCASGTAHNLSGPHFTFQKNGGTRQDCSPLAHLANMIQN